MGTHKRFYACLTTLFTGANRSCKRLTNIPPDFGDGELGRSLRTGETTIAA